MKNPEHTKKHIVIAGFGETGVLTAIYLNQRYSALYQITAISSKPHLLSGQELGTRLAQPEQWKKNYSTEFKQYKHLTGIRIIHGEVLALDTANKNLEYRPFSEDKDAVLEPLKYDVLLIASGVSNGFWRSAECLNSEAINTDIHYYAKQFEQAQHIAVVGGGPSGASCSYQLKATYPEKQIDYFFSGELPLPHHHLKTQKAVLKQLQQVGVSCHSHHRAVKTTELAITNDAVEWQSGQPSVKADLVLWTIGQTQPNSQFLAKTMLDEQGFVNTNPYLQVTGFTDIFCVGDIANTDKNRSSARNFAFKLAAHNIHRYLSGQPQKMKAYKAPNNRWGSVLGVQDDGLRVYTPQGGMFRFPAWSIETLLFPWFVYKSIYRGLIADQKKPPKGG